MDKAGNVHRYESVLVRRTYRDGKKVRHETLANLSKLPAEVIAAIEATLQGQALVPAEAACTVTRSLPHGHVAAVAAMARRLGFPGLLGPACRSRDLVLGLIISRVIRPASKLSTLSRWADCTLGPDLGVAGASTDEVYAAMDWLADRQDAIEKKLAAKHLGPAANPSRMALFDLTSSWVTGRCCELAAYGYSRDGKKGLPQIEYGVLTDPAGRPVAVRVVPGDTADPVAFSDIVEVIRDRFGLTRLVLIGDRGMITSARIDALRKLNDNPDTATAFGWITALRAPDIATLAAEEGALQMSLFDTQDLAEISHPDYPGERLIACRNPALAAERARKRNELLAATDADLAAIAARWQPAACVEPAKSARPSAGSSSNARWASTFAATSPTPPSPTTATRPASTPKPPSMASTYCARRYPPPNSTRPRWWKATRTWPTSNATSAASKPTIWIYRPSTTASTNASAPTS